MPDKTDKLVEYAGTIRRAQDALKAADPTKNAKDIERLDRLIDFLDKLSELPDAPFPP